ncbi:hypothetical protein LguiA_001828 [Lonicera macranthoides]
MAGEGKVHQPNDDLAAIKTTHQDIIAIQEQTIGRMDSIQSTLDALILKVDNHFEEMKAYFGKMKEARDKGILGVHLPASIMPGIILDLEPKETNTEADLKHKETTRIHKEKASNSDSATQRADQVSNLRCHFPELKSQLALVRYPDLPRSPGIHRHKSHNDVVEETKEKASNSDSATHRTDQAYYLRCHFPERKSQLAPVRCPELPRSPGIHRHNDVAEETKEKASNSDSATQRTDQVSYLRCHFPELKSQLALVRYPELPRSPGIHRHNDVVEETQEEDEEEVEVEEEVLLGSHPVAAASYLSSTGSSITNFGGPPSPVGPLPSPPQPMTSESIPTPPPSPNNAPAGPELFRLGSILSIPPDDVPPGDSLRMDTNDENDPQNPQPQKENSVCCGFTFLRRGV